MNQEQRATHPTAHAHPPESGAHAGHAGTTFESSDASPGLVIWSLAIIAGVLVVTFAITVGIQRYLYDANPQGQLPSPLAPERVLPPNPQLQVHPWEELPEVRAHEDQILNSSGRDQDGHTHIAIDRAMDAVVAHLPTHAGVLPGITTPGGEGRDFAGSVSTMPRSYRGPLIKGEIHKSAQQ